MIYNWTQLIPLMLILIVGIPHGAADSVLAIKTYRLTSSYDRITFLLSYLLLVLCTLILWHYFPIFSLLIFLCISAFHFGLGDISTTLPQLNYDQPVQRGLIAWCHGGSLIFLMPILHADTVMPTFQIITHQDAHVVKSMIYCGLLYWFIGLCVLFTKLFMCTHKKSRSLYTKTIVEIVALIFLYAVAPPLWSFTIYFCFIHSMRHAKRLVNTLKLYGVTTKDWIHFTLTSLIPIGIIILASTYYSSEHYSDALLRSTFIGLSALTVPHVILIDILQPLRVKRRYVASL